MSRVPYGGLPVGEDIPFGVTEEEYLASQAASSAYWTEFGEATAAAAATGLGEAAAAAYAGYETYSAMKRNFATMGGAGQAAKRQRGEKTRYKPINSRCMVSTTKTGSKGPPMQMKLYKLIQQSQQHAIDRWQSIATGSVYNLANASQVAETRYYPAGSPSFALKTLLPVFAFNLTALAKNLHNRAGTVVQSESVPFYRLMKDYDSGSVTNLQYLWTPNLGINNATNGAGQDYYWVPEDTSCTGDRVIDDYTVDWVNVRLLIKGAGHFPTECDVMRVKWNDDLGPVRYYKQAGTVYNEDERPTGDDVNNLTAWWDHYLASRTLHPLRSSYLRPGTVATPWKVLSKKTIKIGPVLSSQEVDTASSANILQKFHCDNNFFKMNRPITASSQNPNANLTTRIVTPNTNSTDMAPGFVDTVANTSRSLFQDRHKDEWLVLSFVNYRPSNVNAVSDVQSNPSFDIVVRRKITWNQDTQ